MAVLCSSPRHLLFLLLARIASGQYAGADSCSPCHPTQFKLQSASAHARALKPDREKDWAFGAGIQAVTYVSRADSGHYIEHGLSFYSAVKGLALTPGHATKEGVRYRIFDPGAQILRCFQCHSTGRLSVSEEQKIQPAEIGIRCEACHGAGAEHISRGGDRLAIFNPNRLTAEGLNDMCGACHRKPPAAGEDTDWSNAWNARHQPLYLSQSDCFRQSGGKLSCLTCHNAHTGAVTAGTCQSCHPKPKHVTAVGTRACVTCHMPKVRPQTNLAFANHWIGIYAPNAPLRPRRVIK